MSVLKRKLSVTIPFIALVLLCSCSEESVDATAEPTQTPPPAAPTATAQAENTAKKAVEEYLSGLGYEVVKTKESASMLEFMLTLSGFSDQDLTEPPENWEDVRSSLMDAENAATELSSDVTFVLYLQDNDGKNYLTITQGREKFNAFSSYSEGANPSTITLAEFNEIKTGMTFQQVYDIVGGPGEVISEVDLGLGEEYRTVIQQWTGVGSLGANANVTFQGGKVSIKAQFGLE